MPEMPRVTARREATCQPAPACLFSKLGDVVPHPLTVCNTRAAQTGANNVFTRDNFITSILLQLCGGADISVCQNRNKPECLPILARKRVLLKLTALPDLPKKTALRPVATLVSESASRSGQQKLIREKTRRGGGITGPAARCPLLVVQGALRIIRVERR
jgi:hypothetical protein